MTINDKSYSKKIITKKIDDNTFQLIELVDLTHPECPIVMINGSVEILEDKKDDYK